MKRFLSVIGLGLGLVAAGGAGPALAQDAPVVLTNTTGDCSTYGSPGNWTIVCGDLNPGTGTRIVGPPTVDTVPVSTNPAPAPAPAPATEAAPDTSSEPVATEMDRDGDNYDDAAEAEIGLDPSNADTDGDGVADGDELNLYATDPILADTDGDGVIDGEELFGIKTDPLVWNDFSADSSAPTTAEDAAIAAPDERATPSQASPDAGASALDTDADNVADVDERDIYGTDPTLADTDGDGLSDGQELFASGTDPLVYDTNGDGTADSAENASAPVNS
jgi:hypothetical protein